MKLRSGKLVYHKDNIEVSEAVTNQIHKAVDDIYKLFKDDITFAHDLIAKILILGQKDETGHYIFKENIYDLIYKTSLNSVLPTKHLSLGENGISTLILTLFCRDDIVKSDLLNLTNDCCDLYRGLMKDYIFEDSENIYSELLGE